MDDLLADFVAETREMLEASQGEIIAWEADPTDRSRLDAIFRFVHTVKGNCGFFDFPRLEKLSHAAEDALSDVRAERRESDAALVTAILAIIDRISAMADAIEAGEEFPEGGDEELIAALNIDETETGVVADHPATSLEDASANSAEKSASLKPASQLNAKTIRLPTELLDRVMSGVSDMVLARNDLAHRLSMAGTQPTIDGPFERLTTILSDVRDAITRMRMQRIEYLFGVFPRLVRDLSNELGKQVLIDFEGGNVELDREMVEMIRDPLTHIVRNALDHGIEPPSDRLKAGKRETGLLSIAARQSGNKISIVVTDDGRGLSAEKIAEKAVENGIIDEAALSSMSREDILQLVFEPGLSTAATVSSVSGRGVGLDVVRENLERVGGTIRVTSTPGQGSLFYLTLPLTLSIIAGVTVEQGNECFAIPQSYVEEVVQMDAETLDYTTVGDKGLVTFRGQRIPCLPLDNVLGIADGKEMAHRSAVILRMANGDLIALLVDGVRNITDLVVRPLPPLIMQSELYGGSTQLDDGTPILVLDAPLIALNAGLISHARSQGNASAFEEEAAADKGIQAMLFAGFNGRRMAIRLELVQRLETVSVSAIDRSGSTLRVLIDGKILDLIGLDGKVPETEKIRLLRISDGDCEIAYAIRSVEDAVWLEDDLTPARGEDLVEALGLHEGQPYALVDGYALFARYGHDRKFEGSLTCSLPDTEWAQSFLAPLVARCGFKIVSEDAEEASDLQIKMAGDEPIDEAVDDRVLFIKETQGSANGHEGAVYRYDEAALSQALDKARNAALKAARFNTDGEAA